MAEAFSCTEEEVRTRLRKRYDGMLQELARFSKLVAVFLWKRERLGSGW